MAPARDPVRRAGRDGRLRCRGAGHGARLPRPPRVAGRDARGHRHRARRHQRAADRRSRRVLRIARPRSGHRARRSAGITPRHCIALGRSAFRCPGVDVTARRHRRRPDGRPLPDRVECRQRPLQRGRHPAGAHRRLLLGRTSGAGCAAPCAPPTEPLQRHRQGAGQLGGGPADGAVRAGADRGRRGPGRARRRRALAEGVGRGDGRVDRLLGDRDLPACSSAAAAAQPARRRHDAGFPRASGGPAVCVLPEALVGRPDDAAAQQRHGPRDPDDRHDRRHARRGLGHVVFGRDLRPLTDRWGSSSPSWVPPKSWCCCRRAAATST